jgi:integrase
MTVSALAAVLQDWQGSRTEGYVFESSLTGRPLYASTILGKTLKPAGEMIRLRGLGWHDLRHSYRTYLDETGAPIGVQQKLMRHASIQTTANVCGSSTRKAKAQANRKVVEMVLTQEPPRIEAVAV